MSLKLNERYPSRFNNPTTAYPLGSFKNRTTPTAKDGSYLEKDWANDKEGFFQSLLSTAGITANGAVDAVGASQFFDALQALKQIQAGTAFTTAGDSTALTLTPAPSILAYSANQRFCVKFHVDSGVNPTINVSGRGVKNLKQYNSTGAKVAAVFATGHNSDIVYDGTDWVLLDPLPSTFDFLNSVRIDVASSNTVNLLTSAPATRHINITGTTSIASFTISAGQCYFVRFAGVLTLTNGASIVTQSGVNISTAAGDTCIIRATANNVVEVLCYTSAISQALGYGQTWQDVTASRAGGTNYVNSTGKPIAVSCYTGDAGTQILGLLVNGITVSSVKGGVGVRVCAFGIVPPGATYSVTVGGTEIQKWMELR